MSQPMPSGTPAAAPAARHAAPSYSPDLRAHGSVGKQRGPWAVWFLPFITLGIYYLVWYYKINKELAEFAPGSVKVKPGLAVLALFIPIVNWVSLANTAGRIRAAGASVGVTVEISGFVTILASFWFSSQTRYLQRRLNSVWSATGI